MPRTSDAQGFSLLETLVAVSIFALVGLSTYDVFVRLLNTMTAGRMLQNATSVLMEEIEIVRNLPYSSVGIVGGIPSGVLSATATATRSGQSFSITRSIRNIDDPFDGTLGGSPNDLSPADYKMVDITVSCTNCKNDTPVSFTTLQAPKSLETSSTNGALFVRVLDANGLPVQGANVSILNQATSPDIVINDVTDVDGWLRIVDAPPGVNVYEISVTKSGFSTARTYAPGDVANPNPTVPHSTVVQQQVTQLTLSIDAVSSIDVASVTSACTPVAAIPFRLRGAKTIGASPNVYKYDENHTTSGAGSLGLGDMEWDTYTASMTAGAYQLAGTIPLSPFSVAPNSTQSFQLVVEPADARALLVTVHDAATQLPISDAAVTVDGPGGTETRYTGRGFLGQTDWSGGSGQGTYTDAARYHSDDGNIVTDSPTGELKLRETFGTFAPSGFLTSSTFDTGSASNFHEILWLPGSQSVATGAEPVAFQIATNDDDLTWDFLGPDGTSGTWYDSTTHAINDIHDGGRYLRYRIRLTTDSPTETPNVSDVFFTYTSTCVPPGQVSFSGLPSGTHTVTVSKSGYTTATDSDVSISSDWQEHTVTLGP